MTKSMTGYGKGEAVSERGRFTVEIRSVNHRYGEVSVRMPRGFLSLEQEVKRSVTNVLKRGKIDVTVQWEEITGEAAMPQADAALAQGYAALFRDLSASLGLSAEVPLALVIAQKGVLRENATAIDEAEFLPQLIAAVQAAVGTIDAMRRREGEALAADLMARRTQVAEWAEQVGGRAPQVVAEYRQKLKLRLDQLLEGVEMDAARLAQEVALMADRCDVTEELVRLSSHFAQFDETMRLSEPVGRKLDFLMQEMNREVNTIGSKSSDAEMTTLVIRIKAEMEKMREQVQNVE
ncbi:MAG: YicC family protein [Deltaproteobacteria bacterium]|nr:YicC family protein [Deltaproteobacteria bacterium]